MKFRVSKIALLIVLLWMSQYAFSQEYKSYEVPNNIAVIPAPEQPIPFSHQQHAGTLGLPCSYCHINPDDGRKMGFPSEDTCMSCHAGIAAEKPSIIKLKEYANRAEAIPWQPVYEISQGITWSHHVHIQADVQCETCHGDVKQMEVMSQVKATTAMASCISCHQEHPKQVDSNCSTCHAWPSDKFLLSVDPDPAD